VAVYQPGVKGRFGHLLAQIGEYKQPQLVEAVTRGEKTGCETTELIIISTSGK
jgi:hypothetical protein